MLKKMDDTLVLETQESGITSQTAPQEDIGEDNFSWPEEAEPLIGNPSADQEDVRMDAPPSTESARLRNSLVMCSVFQLC